MSSAVSARHRRPALTISNGTKSAYAIVEYLGSCRNRSNDSGFVDPPWNSAQALSIAAVSPTISVLDLSGKPAGASEAIQQLVLSIALQNDNDVPQPFVALVEVRDFSGITLNLAWSSGILAPLRNTTIGISWMPPAPGYYATRAFVITNLENPHVLSPVTTKIIEIVDGSKITHFEDYGQPTFETLSNYTLKQVQDLQVKVCKKLAPELAALDESDDPRLYSQWLPQRVSFESIEPDRIIFRQGCLNTPAGMIYSHFTFYNDIPARGHYVHIHIESPQQAVEYLAYFVLQSGQRILASQGEYDDLLVGCDTISSSSPVSDIRVTEVEEDSFVVEVNVMDVTSGWLRYEVWYIPEKPLYRENIEPIYVTRCGQEI
jgi:hypothetical protein